MRLIKRRGRYLLKTEDPTEVVEAHSLGAVYDPSARGWVLPPDFDLDRLPEGVEIDAEVRAEWEAWKRRNEHLEHIRVQADMLTPGVSPLLDGYQRVGVRFLTTAKRAILADAMGLGKTAQAIASADFVKAERILVVTKKSLITNWLHEIGRFAGWGEAARLAARDTDPPKVRWLVTNYESARKHVGALIDKYRPDVLIVDEALHIKNRQAQRTKAVWAIAKKTEYVWLLTGTLIRNQVDELWSLLHTLDPDRYTSYWRFRERHCLEEPVFSGGRVVTKRIIEIGRAHV